MAGFTDRLKHAWNAFFGRDAPDFRDYGPSYSTRPDRRRLTRGNERSIVTAMYNRISMDVCAVGMRHVRVDDEGRYVETIKSGLNNCLTVESNLDQTARAFLQDAVLSMFDEGVVAIVPVDTDISPIDSGSFDIHTLRTGRIVQWMPEHVRVEVYNQRSGRKEEVTLPKKMVAIVENPLYAVMNEPNSTLQRLLRKLVLLDAVDEQSSSGKLDLIIQLPYVTKTPMMKERAESRRKLIEEQLSGSKYGIAYTDGTEKITQLNRPIENNLLQQVEYLTGILYSQLGLTEEVFNGTANEATMLNYNNRTIEPILSAFADEMKRKFLTKTARSQGQSITFFREPFKLCPVTNLADIADRLTRNAILSANEFRAILGYKPANDPSADMLLNQNMPFQDTATGAGGAMPYGSDTQPGVNLQSEERTDPMETPVSLIMQAASADDTT